MKNQTTLILAILLSVGSVFADPAQLPTTLANTMKAMAKDLKAITTQVTVADQNANSAALAEEFVQLVLHAKSFVPDTVANLPADQQDAQKAQYAKRLDEAAELGKQLVAALQANDNAKASLLLNQLVDAKKTGHSEFKD